MKKIICAVMCILAFAAMSAGAEKSIIRLGVISKLNTSEEEFGAVWRSTFAPQNGNKLDIIIKFYNSLNSLLLVLNKNEISEIVLPEASAQYVIRNNNNFEPTLTLRSPHYHGLAFGFRHDAEPLRNAFNDALASLTQNWTLSALEARYISNLNTDPVEFMHFDKPDATIKVAITGDLPPFDLISENGVPAGYNTAILAEIGRALNFNIELVEVDAGARTAALVSGRADVVFWYELAGPTSYDAPDGVILSEPYYYWDKFVHIHRKAPQSSTWWNFKDSILNLYWR